MCFRPPSAKLNKCYKCGKINKPMATACVDCGAELKLGSLPCPECETLKDPMEVCPKCGFVPEVECPKCGTKNPVTNAECSNCGFKAAQSGPPPGARGAAPKMPPAPPKAPPAPPKAPPAPHKKPDK